MKKIKKVNQRFTTHATGCQFYIFRLENVKLATSRKAFEDFMLRHNQILEEEVQRRTQDLRNMSSEMVWKLTTAAEFRDTDTGEHISIIGFYSNKLAEAMNLPADFIETINFSSRLHDIGKIGIPDSILLKPGALKRDKFEIMKTHSAIGEKILSGSNYPIK